MRILLVKTSSLGDVIHNLPVVSDLRLHCADAQIDWVVEEAFADIPRLHPGVGRVIPVALRRWRKQLLAAQTWREIGTFRAALRGEAYDYVLDTQGLLKSALLAAQARGKRVGHAADSAREPLAARFYDEGHSIAKSLHAVERNRQLAAAALGYTNSGAPDYGLAGLARANGPTVVLLTATSRDDKLWAEDHWIALGRHFAAQGLSCLLPAGSAVERARAQRIAAAIPAARALPPSSLRELAEVLAASRLVVGVDTGLVHLAAALDRPTIALFCASEPGLTGVLAGPRAVNLGARGAAPEVADVLAAAESLH